MTGLTISPTIEHINHPKTRFRRICKSWKRKTKRCSQYRTVCKY